MALPRRAASRSRANARCEGIRPRPAALQPRRRAPGGAHEPSGDVQQALANPLGLGKCKVTLQAQRAGKAEQLLGAEGELKLGPVVRECGEGMFCMPVFLATSDHVLDPGGVGGATLGRRCRRSTGR
jgi:hypothetical protein